MKLIIPSLVVCSLLCVGSTAIASDSHEADESIEHGLRATLNERHVHFHVHKGVVTLEGHVRTEQDRAAIESLVRGTPDVAAVEDKLKVDLPQPGNIVTEPGAVVTTPSTVVTTPGAVVTSPGTVVVQPNRIPVYMAEPPAPRTAIVTMPPPVVIPEYPRLKIQASSEDDLTLANRIARHLGADALPSPGLQDVRITVRDGIVTLKGDVDSQTDHDALISSIQRAGGMTAIYDRMQVR